MVHTTDHTVTTTRDFTLTTIPMIPTVLAAETAVTAGTTEGTTTITTAAMAAVVVVVVAADIGVRGAITKTQRPRSEKWQTSLSA